MPENYFEKNLTILKEKSGCGYIVETLSGEPAFEEGISVGVEDVAGKTVLYAVKDGQTYLLDSMYDSADFIDSWVEGAQIKWDSKFFITGFGNGMIIRKVLNEIDKESMVFVYEPSVNLFRTVLENFDVSDILCDRRMHLFLSGFEQNGINIHNTICGKISYRDVFNARIVKYPNYNILFPDETKKFEEEIDQVAKTITVNNNTYGKFGHFFIKNSIRNSVLMTKAKKLSDTIPKINTNVPGILVSCGPSLDKNVDFLKRAKGRAIIVAGDSSVRAMAKHGIYPDIYVTVDMDKPMEIFDVEGMYDIPAVCSIDGTYNALKNQKAPLYVFATEDEYINTYMAKAGIEFFSLGTAGCEATSAMSFMMALGLRKIILVGQDLAYTGGTVYASDSAGASWDQQKLIDDDNCITEGIDGQPILTSRQFNTYRHWFERQIVSVEDLELINATEGGARVHGAREMTLNDAIDEYCTEEFDVREAIESSANLFDGEDVEAFADHMRAIPKHIEELRKVINEGLKIYDDLGRVVSAVNIDGKKLKRLLEKNQQNIFDLNASRVFYYIECMVMTEMNELHRESANGEKDDIEELKATISNGKKRYKLLLTGIDRFYEMWEDIKDERF